VVERQAYPDGQLSPLRAGHVTASSVAALVNAHPFKTRLAYWAELRGILLPNAGNRLTQRGILFEPVVARAVGIELPEADIRYPLNTYFFDRELRYGCSPDAVMQLDGELLNLQLKVVNKRSFEQHWECGPPPYIELQVTAENDLMGVDGSMVAALVLDSYDYQLRLFPVPRNPGREARLRELVAAFWDDVRTGNRPPASPDQDGPTVAAMFPLSSSEPVLDLTGDNRLSELLPARAMLKGEISSLEKQVEGMDTEIKLKLAKHERATLPGWKLTWKTQHRKERVQPATTVRPLLVTQLKDEAA
jgi:hypothetical protein